MPASAQVCSTLMSWDTLGIQILLDGSRCPGAQDDSRRATKVLASPREWERSFFDLQEEPESTSHWGRAETEPF